MATSYHHTFINHALWVRNKIRYCKGHRGRIEAYTINSLKFLLFSLLTSPNTGKPFFFENGQERFTVSVKS